MNPLLESLTGLKTLNDQYIAADLMQDTQVRISLLAQCLLEHPPHVQDTVARELRTALEFMQQLTEYCIRKAWILPDASAQWEQDLKWAYKAVKMV
ncbi:hypothetical protein [Paenibacillus sp. XY044]|uniref:hypothetical protein n=1 Tax=Paenibacillus sp. XY044 TaxID=2026089 RepID=UPI000B97EE46|nr:hypothetical protein [Paenibacillus sp. XY044]OZB97924.1 hypothetical protein CJP46_01770 [Paenibacillus sp. XY044]